MPERIDTRVATALAGGGLLAALAVALAPGAPTAVAVVLTAIGGVAALALLLPAARTKLRQTPVLGSVGVLLVLIALWIIAGLHAVGGPSDNINSFAIFPDGNLNPALVVDVRTDGGFSLQSWPWRIGHTSLPEILLLLITTGGALVLLSDAVRLQLGYELTPRVPWRLLVTPLERRSQVVSRAVPGLALVIVSVLLGVGIADSYLVNRPHLQALVIVLIAGFAAVLILTPLTIGTLMRTRRDKAGLAREQERQRFAAHLHDSVLQTLALIQRQAHDPAAVSRLARRQELALRAWMAGEAELASETLVTALREVVAEVEDEYELTVELTAIGDRPLEQKGEALVAAAREALRNAARHGAGAPVYVFCEIGASQVEVFVRDEGPGFDPELVARERRGIRDAVIGRMALVGGHATIESNLGEGTEVALAL